MYYKNARIFCSDFRFRTGAFQVENGVFGEILPDTIPDDAIAVYRNLHYLPHILVFMQLKQINLPLHTKEATPLGATSLSKF